MASPADAKPILDLLDGFRASQTLFVAVELGIFDTLERAEVDTPGVGLTACEVACDLARGSGQGVSEEGLARLLDAACSLGLLSKGSSSRYRCTALSRQFLTSGSDTPLSGYVAHSSKVVWPLFSGLRQAVSKGGNVWQECMGFPGNEIFADTYATEEALLRFMRGMHSFAALSAKAVVTAFDLSQYRQWMDLGGATGALMMTAAATYPSARMVVVDLPRVVAAAQQHFTHPPHVTDPALMDRVTWVAGDFFAHPNQLPRADLVVMSRILHDWQLDKCEQLLRTVYSILPRGGAVLIAEMLLDEDKAGPPRATMQSLNMLVQTRGRERSASEYRSLLEGAGFTGCRSQRTGAYLDAVIAVKE